MNDRERNRSGNAAVRKASVSRAAYKIPVHVSDASGNSDASMRGHFLGSRVQRSLAESSITPAHMQGLQFIHLSHPDSNRQVAYNAQEKSIHVSSADQGELLHELGHHVAHQNGGRPENFGASEGNADAFMHRHFPAPFSPNPSGYEHAAYGVEDNGSLRTTDDPSGRENARQYRAAREAG